MYVFQSNLSKRSKSLLPGTSKGAAWSWQMPVRRELAKIKLSKLSSAATNYTLPHSYLSSASLSQFISLSMVHLTF